jgi:hypothetical protein
MCAVARRDECQRIIYIERWIDKFVMGIKDVLWWYCKLITRRRKIYGSWLSITLSPSSMYNVTIHGSRMSHLVEKGFAPRKEEGRGLARPRVDVHIRVRPSSREIWLEEG